MNIEEMSRPEVIQELRKHAHHTWYHMLLEFKTKDLKILLDYYKGKFFTIEVGIKVTEVKGDEIVDCDLLEVSLGNV